MFEHEFELVEEWLQDLHYILDQLDASIRAVAVETSCGNIRIEVPFVVTRVAEMRRAAIREQIPPHMISEVEERRGSSCSDNLRLVAGDDDA